MANVAIGGNSPKMTSREIAELTGKQHGHVMRDIEIMLEQLGEGLNGYIQIWRHPQNGQQYREYALDREHTECLVTGYSASLRMKVIKRLHELEEQNSPVPQTLPEALRGSRYGRTEGNAGAEGSGRRTEGGLCRSLRRRLRFKSLRATAKVLNMPEKAMIDALIRDKVLFRQSGNLLPHALRQRDGLFTVKTGTSDFGHAFTQTG